MTITKVRNATFISDPVIFIRDKLRDNITDPLSSSRNELDRFVRTSYPKREVNYPLITVVDNSPNQISRAGMQSESTIIRLSIQIRVWARNIKERDEISQSVYDYLRTNQFSGDNFKGAELHDFAASSMVNVPGEKEQSKVLEVSYLFIAE